MKATELIGKRVIRTAPVKENRYESTGFGSGFLTEVDDYYYCENPVTIIAATDTNIIVACESIIGDSISTTNLSCKYCDDNWEDYDSLFNQGKEIFEQLKKELDKKMQKKKQ